MTVLDSQLKIEMTQLDLFNPPKQFNYDIMINELDFSNFENPTIQIVWEDLPENFTQDKIKGVKHYFQKKYNTTNVNVLTKSKSVDDDTQQTVDVSLNVTDVNYQLDLLKKFLESKNYDDYIDDVISINRMVENRMSEDEIENVQFKKWYVRRIEFSNFLSYGEDQVIDFDKCNGVVVVESDPPNFGGKTVLSVDLLLFLFFNETTKTTKAEEIFNRFTNQDKVIVKGEVTIDGEDYLIVRTIERKMSKKGDWNVKTDLDFFKRLSDGQLQNFTGEQRRETETFIKNSIGTKDDFLMTILTTATNLEELLESKPTARGQVLSRFMGLEFLKRKEEVGKEIYSEFSKSKMSNVYNTEELKTEIENSSNKISELKGEIVSLSSELLDIDNKLTTGRQYRDDMLKKKHTIDTEISMLNPTKTDEEISGLKKQKDDFIKKISELNVVEPKEFYHEDKHDEIKDEMKTTNGDLISSQNKVKEIEDLVKKYGDGIQCEHCGIKLMEAALTKKKIDELSDWETKVDKLSKKWKDLEIKEKSYTQLKKDFDEYEKNKLIKEKYELSVESCDLKIETLNDKISRWNDVQDKIKENQHIDTQIIKADLRIESLEGDKKSKTSEITNKEYQIKSSDEKIDNYSKIIVKISEEEEKDKIYKMYLEAFGKNGLSKMIMKTMMPLINSELQRLMEDSSYFKLEIRINDKNEVEFVMIDNGTGVEKLMVSGSGYERTIASLALRSVLSKICSLPKPNIVVFDEVFGKISNDNLEMVSEFFIKIKEYFEKIFVITHNPMVGQWADTIVKIKKVDNVSKIMM
jgi:DNA repair exonuclease SbcCD ATPase subunit